MTRTTGRSDRAGRLVLAAVAGILVLAAMMDSSGQDRDPRVPDASESGAEYKDALLEVGPTAADQRIEFNLVLVFPGSAALVEYVAATADPRSADFRKFLEADEIGSRYGLPDDDLARVVEWATGHDMSVEGLPPQRLVVRVATSAKRAEDLFEVELRDFVDRAGGRYHAPTGAARVPEALRRLVAGVDGLDTRPTEEPAFGNLIAAGPKGGITPPIGDRAFEFEPLRALGLFGEGQTVAIVSLDTFDPADVAAFDLAVGISGPPVEKVPVNGGVSTPGRGSVEVNLDIDVVRAIAPKAQILDYEAPNAGNSIADIIDRIVSDGRAKIATISWGSCEPDDGSASLSRHQRSFAAAAAAGVSVFASSGDKGAYDCRHSDWSDLRVAAGAPGVDPNVIAVGGTYVSMTADGTYIDETAWEDPITGWATGGGLSITFQRPAWQVGLGVDNEYSNGMRQVPDVAGPADTDSGYVFISDGSRQVAGGTSASSPFWAGYVALVRQLGQQEGVDGLGALGPTLYAVSAESENGSLFRDITRGGNLLHNAGPGWDYATGLGTPRGAALAHAIVDYLKRGR